MNQTRSQNRMLLTTAAVLAVVGVASFIITMVRHDSGATKSSVASTPGTTGITAAATTAPSIVQTTAATVVGAGTTSSLTSGATTTIVGPATTVTATTGPATSGVGSATTGVTTGPTGPAGNPTTSAVVPTTCLVAPFLLVELAKSNVKLGPISPAVIVDSGYGPSALCTQTNYYLPPNVYLLSESATIAAACHAFSVDAFPFNIAVIDTRQLKFLNKDDLVKSCAKLGED